MWQADRGVFRVSTLGGFQWRPASAGTYHQARKLAVALLDGGVGAGSGAKYSAMAEPVLSPGDATGTKDRESRHGQKTSDSFVLDDAPRMGLRADEKVRFVRRTARKSPWCAVEHRVIDWASCSSF